MEWMSERAPENGQDWLLPEDSRPPLIGELVERIEEALATARSAEAAAVSIGDAALDAAEQARSAAELAERASAAMRPRPSVPTDDGLGDFGARADHVAERLRRLQRVPLSAA